MSKLFLSRLYVPFATALLVVFAGNWLAVRLDVDPAAADPRIRLGLDPEPIPAAEAGISEGEAHLAESVLRRDFRPDGRTPQLLYLGNSQTFVIMDRIPGDMIAPQWLQILLARQAGPGEPAIDVRVGSLANLTMAEFLIRVVHAAESSPQRADIVIGLMVPADFRALHVREEVLEQARLPAVRSELLTLLQANSDLIKAGRALAPALEAPTEDVGTANNESSSKVWSDTLEDHFQGFLHRYPLFSRRQEVRMRLGLTVFEWRNWVFGIQSDTVRPLPPATYDASVELVEMSLRYAASRGIQIVLCFVPIRPIQPNPNLPSDLDRFRKDLQSLCRRYRVTCLDYMGLIPEPLWTNYPDYQYEGGRDFAHFTGRAHKLLAEHLVADIGAQLSDWARRRIEAERQ